MVLITLQLRPMPQLRPAVKISTNLFRDEIGIVDVFLQLEQNLRLYVVFVVVHQTPEEIGVAQ